MTNVHISVISDTHGLLRPEALAAVRGSDYIIHAGDPKFCPSWLKLLR
jgi:predicted phosphodiesterase